MKIQCKHCPKSTGSSLDVARSEGWRMFSGESVTGKQIDDVVCPRCAGTAPEGDEPSWQVRCLTCDWVYEDEGGDGPLDAKSAKHLAHDHECEPEVAIAAPDTDVWLDPWEVNDDGSVREAERKPVATVAVGGGRL